MKAETSPRLAGWLIAIVVAVAIVLIVGGSVLLVRVDNVVQTTHTLLLNGKTASAVSAKKTASLAEQIKGLLITDHTQTVAQDKHADALSVIRTSELQDIQTLIKNEAASSVYLKTGVDSLRTILVYIGGSLTSICKATPNCVLPKG